MLLLRHHSSFNSTQCLLLSAEFCAVIIYLHVLASPDCEQFFVQMPETRRPFPVSGSRGSLCLRIRDRRHIQRVCFLRGRTTTAAASRAETVSSMTHRGGVAVAAGLDGGLVVGVGLAAVGALAILIMVAGGLDGLALLHGLAADGAHLAAGAAVLGAGGSLRAHQLGLVAGGGITSPFFTVSPQTVQTSSPV